MSEIHYLISDAAKLVNVETHVLRYWEEELALPILRNDMGHRYYTEAQIRLLKQIRDLKDKGYQLKAIKKALDKMFENHAEVLEPEDMFEEEMSTALSQVEQSEEALVAEDKMERFQSIMNQIIAQALQENNEKLEKDIGALVADKVADEMDYQMKLLNEREEMRYKKLDDAIRLYQKVDKSKAEAAASVVKLPFLKWNKKKKFGRGGKKLF
ncbi:MAG: helix-turn-helix domain-containing protein [bacterium]|nr:helix-turn-helix domain-containing protein [bacterium]